MENTGVVCVALWHEGFLDGSREGDLELPPLGEEAVLPESVRVCSDEWAAKKQLQ